MVKIQNTDNTKSCEDVKQQELLFIAGENIKWYSYVGKTVKQFLRN
jgi:hypothetical protein